MDFLFTKKRKAIKDTREKILFVYPLFSSFVRTDYNILSEKYNVIKLQYVHKKLIVTHIVNQIRIKIWLLKNILSAKAVFVWFADYHSFLPILFAKLFKKKSFLVLGGYDVTYVPEYNYGAFNNPIRGFCARYSIQNASFAFAVSDNIKEDGEARTKKSNIQILYTGYSKEKFYFDETQKRSGVISVIGAETKQRMYIKGVDLIVRTAKLLPDVQFSIVDVNRELFNNEFGKISNITIIDKIEQSKLIEHFNSSSVYLQLSMREGLPNSVCEAMLCGAIPVGVNAGGIPIAIGGCGFVSQKRDENEIDKLIRKALNADDSLRKCARKRVVDNFSLIQRKEKLLSVISKNI